MPNLDKFCEGCKDRLGLRQACRSIDSYEDIAKVLIYAFDATDLGDLVGHGMKALKGSGNPHMLASAITKELDRG